MRWDQRAHQRLLWAANTTGSAESQAAGSSDIMRGSHRSHRPIESHRFSQTSADMSKLAPVCRNFRHTLSARIIRFDDDDS